RLHARAARPPEDVLRQLDRAHGGPGAGRSEITWPAARRTPAIKRARPAAASRRTASIGEARSSAARNPADALVMAPAQPASPAGARCGRALGCRSGDPAHGGL